MDIHGELTARKKYRTALLAVKATELDITLHDKDKIKSMLAEGEDATIQLKLTEEELNYGKPMSSDWLMEGEGVSTGWETIKDTAPSTTISIHPDAHLVCETQEIAEICQQHLRRADNQGWTQRHHPNMVIKASPVPPNSSGS
jgi:hypothetical protein